MFEFSPRLFHPQNQLQIRKFDLEIQKRDLSITFNCDATRSRLLLDKRLFFVFWAMLFIASAIVPLSNNQLISVAYSSP